MGIHGRKTPILNFESLVLPIQPFAVIVEALVLHVDSLSLCLNIPLQQFPCVAQLLFRKLLEVLQLAGHLAVDLRLITGVAK